MNEKADFRAKSWAKKQIKNPNNRRSWTLSKLKRKNHKLTREMEKYSAIGEMTQVQASRFVKLQKDVSRCSNYAVYRTALETGETAFIGAASCKNKLCFICNWARQKNIRRKYKAWFDANPEIVEIRKNENYKYTTATIVAGGKYKDWREVARHGYDLMHLTLTVPHTAENGFNGDLYYFEKISALFNRMRKESKLWQWLVFGGEYGIEDTRNEQGQHIHIHSLLLVRRERQSRNKLHKEVLEQWNRLTVNRHVERESFSRAELEAIARSNRMIDEAFAAGLHPKGSTFIGLENIYTYTADGQKQHGAAWNSKEMIIAVMETISYHFDPYAFDKATGKFDLPLMAELAPILHGKRLYDKFGCLYGEKSLNVTDSSNVADEYTEAVEQFVDTDTGEITGANRYYIANPLFVRHLPERDYSIALGRGARRQAVELQVTTTGEAMRAMSKLVTDQFKNRRS